MYTAHWHLDQKPFENTPDPEFFYLSSEHAEALDRLQYLVDGRMGAGMLTGEYGSGKTTMVRVLRQRLDLDQYRLAYLDYPRFSSDGLLKETLYQLGEDSGGDNLDCRHRLGDMFYQTSAAGAHTLVVVDEAQVIPENGALEELRLLLNFQLEDAFLVTVLFVGQPEFRERVRKIPQLDQRITVRYHLHNFDLEGTRLYISHRLKRAGARDSIFTDPAVEAIYRSTLGTPRRINNICDLCLFTGARQQAQQITDEIVRIVA